MSDAAIPAQDSSSRAPNLAVSNRFNRWIRIISAIIIVISLFLLMRQLPMDRLINLLTQQVDALGAWGLLVYGLIYIMAAILFVPGSAMTLAAGILFGLLWGLITVSLASTIAAALAFLIGRYLARDTVKQWADRYPRFGAIDRAIGEGGWKVIALLRLSPAVPYSMSNYLFGLTRVSFWPYVLASWLAMLPGTFMYIYLGYAGRAGLAAAAGETRERSTWEWALLGVGLVATIIVTLYVTRLAGKKVKEQTHIINEQNQQNGQRPEHVAGPVGRSSWIGSLLLSLLALMLAGTTVYTYVKPETIKGLFGPPAVTMTERYERKPAGPSFDHSLLDKLLKEHVDERGMVDYQAFNEDPSRLDRYIASLAKAPVEKLGRDERLALLINAYNAFHLRLILDYYPLDSIKDIPADKRWEDKRWNIGGREYSLNQIEHERIRPNFKEPRIHFALVCAAIGCPPLRQESYVADRLDRQLQDQSLYVHSHETWFQLDTNAGVVKLTPLYDWYRGDFQQVAGSILKYAARFSPALADVLEKDRDLEVTFLDYDWSLNSQRKSR